MLTNSFNKWEWPLFHFKAALCTVLCYTLMTQLYTNGIKRCYQLQLQYFWHAGKNIKFQDIKYEYTRTKFFKEQSAWFISQYIISSSLLVNTNRDNVHFISIYQGRLSRPILQNYGVEENSSYREGVCLWTSWIWVGISLLVWFRLWHWLTSFVWIPWERVILWVF